MAVKLKTKMNASAVQRLSTEGIRMKSRRKGMNYSLESYRMMFIDTNDYNPDIGWEEIKEVKKPERTSIQLYPKENITSV